MLLLHQEVFRVYSLVERQAVDLMELSCAGRFLATRPRNSRGTRKKHARPTSRGMAMSSGLSSFPTCANQFIQGCYAKAVNRKELSGSILVGFLGLIGEELLITEVFGGECRLTHSGVKY